MTPARAGNLLADAGAWGLLAVAGLALAAFGPNAMVPMWLLGPYAHTVLAWSVAYLALRRAFFPLKPLYFAVLWATQEWGFNAATFLGNPGADWSLIATSWRWWAYESGLLAAGLASGAWLLRRGRLRLSRPWLLAAAGFWAAVAALNAAGLPLVAQDPLTGAVAPGDWVFEAGGGALVLALYLLGFRERGP